MTDIARLVVQLSADSARLQRDLDKAQSQINRYQARTNAAFNDAAKKIGAAVGVAAVAAAAGLGVLVKNAIDAADELGKLSQKVGISVEELSKLQYAAKLAEVDTAALQTSLVKLSKSAIESKDGIGDAAEAFKALGVDLLDANGNLKSTDQLFLDTADAFAKFADGPEKAAAALAIFGKAGADMIPLLNGGAAAIKAAGVELETFGGVIKQRTAEAADKFNDNLDKLKTTSSALGSQIAADLLPELGIFTDRLFDLVKDGDTATKFADGLSVAFRGLAGTAIVISNAFQIAGGTIANYAAIAGAVLSGDFRGALEIAKLGVEDLKTDLNDIRHAFDGAAKSATKAGEAIKDASKADAPGKPRLGFDPESAEKARKAGEAAAKQAADDAKKLAEAAQKAAEDDLNERLDAELKLNDKVNQARQDLFKKTVTRAEAETAAIETKYQALIAELIAAGRDVEIPLVVELMSVEKAQADFTRLTEDLEKIRADHQRRMEDIEQSVITGARSPLEGIRAQQEEGQRFAGESEGKLGEMEALGGLSPDQQAEILAGYEDVENRKTEALIAGEEARRQVQEQYMDAGLIALGDAAETAAAFGKKGFKAFKAFAIAQTIISTYDAAQKSYSSLAAIPVIGPALGAAAAAAAIGAGLARVAAIRAAEPTGYMEGGYTGNGSRTGVAGVVHGQEGVVNTNALSAAAEAINDPNFWSVSKNATSAMAGGSAQINIFNTPGTVVVKRDDKYFAELVPQLLEMVDQDQARRADSQLGRNFQAMARKLGAQPSAGR